MPDDPCATAANPSTNPVPLGTASGSPERPDTSPQGARRTGLLVDGASECVIKGPYYPVGDVDFECRTHGVVAVLRDPARYAAADIRRAEMRCPIGEPDAD
jgi:hypothetical protein